MNDSFCQSVKKQLLKYTYEIYDVYPTSNVGEFCIMTNSMMIFTNEENKSITISFECMLEPQIAGRNMIILNECKEINCIYVTESYIFDSSSKSYVVGDDAKKTADKIIYDKCYNQIIKEITKDQIYSHILATQKCHEC